MNKKIFGWIVLFLLMAVPISPVSGDLEWITGGTPKNTSDKPGGAVIQDAPGVENHPTPASNQNVILSHLITCTAINNHYPSDSVNYFFLNKNHQICFYAYFLMKPSSRIHSATAECFSPNNLLIARYEREYQVGFTDQLLTIQNETYQFFILEMSLGMEKMRSEYGQTGLPRDTGLYTIHLSVDGELVGITFFYVRPEEWKTTPVPTVAPVSPKSGENLLPMSTPFSNIPIPKGIQ